MDDKHSSPAVPMLVERLRGDTSMSDRPWAVELMIEAATALEQAEREVKRLGTAYDDLLIEAGYLREALEKIANGSTAYVHFWQRDIALAALRRKG